MSRNICAQSEAQANSKMPVMMGNRHCGHHVSFIICRPKTRLRWLTSRLLSSTVARANPHFRQVRSNAVNARTKLGDDGRTSASHTLDKLAASTHLLHSDAETVRV